ncbi:monooxygenase-like protein [Biscogniauxia marginata]|nr:monooxygenase-like protein [Biscogniauxia marginata]
METTEVVIVGAGPSGLTLALSLAKFKIKSVILEKETEITLDPRGVSLNHDAIRILWNLGIGDQMKDIGPVMELVNFHKSSFAQKPFYTVDTSQDAAQQTLPNYIIQVQPTLELVLQKKVEESPFCDLRRGCTVEGRDQLDTKVDVRYKDKSGESRSVRGSWLVGADGKRGVVRKKFLEPSAGVKQVDSSYKYEGTWVAANLKINLPTPKTHPKFPLWGYGYTPEGVYDLFWPKGWHFCSPPGKPTATGRFGPHELRYWRHEFAQNDWDDSMNSEDLLWEHITPMITLKEDRDVGAFACGEVTYPRDCIEIHRCRPFRFAHKVVNKWFDNRTILIGDAAHVFPPFGGQGVGCGLRDAYELGWRLLALQRLPSVDRALCDRALGAWAEERVQGVKDAAATTEINGHMCNEGGMPSSTDPFPTFETRGYKPAKDGFFLATFGGGGRLAQIYVQSRNQSPILSDRLLSQDSAAMTVLVIARDADPSRLLDEAKAAIGGSNIDPSILSEHSIKVFSPAQDIADGAKIEVYSPVSQENLSSAGIHVPTTYNASDYLSRFEPDTKFVIARPDLYIFALAKDSTELAECLAVLQRRLSPPA